jgi:hypothetical protein
MITWFAERIEGAKVNFRSFFCHKIGDDFRRRWSEEDPCPVVPAGKKQALDSCFTE